MKERLYYWGTVIPLLVAFGIMYCQYKDLEGTVYDTHTKCNRQIQVIYQRHSEQLEELKMKHQANIIHQSYHHRQEIGQCVQFYTSALEEAKEK